MKTCWNIFATLASLTVLSPVAAAEQPEVPQGIESEWSLPSRHPYVVQDALRLCTPARGFWVDLGAGKGQIAIPLTEATGHPVVMLDPNSESMAEGLAAAREKGLGERVFAVVGKAEAMPFPDNTVDLVVSRGSIFFWEDPGKGLQEVYRVLRPGAKAYIGGGAGSGYPKWAVEKLLHGRSEGVQNDGSEKWRRFVELRSPEQMKQWADKAGLPEYEILGRGAISDEDQRVGQGVWLLFQKKPAEDKP